jgi:hypothetical protein
MKHHKNDLGNGKVTHWITTLVNEKVLTESSEDGSAAKYIGLNLGGNEDDGS